MAQFRTECIQANGELQKVKSENKILKYELTVHKVDNEELANMQIENHQLKKDNADVMARLDLFREEFLKANAELQIEKLIKEQLRNELNDELSNLKERLHRAEDALFAMRNDNNGSTKMMNEEIQHQCVDDINTMPCNRKYEIFEKMNGTRETMSKRKNEATASAQCVNNFKRQKLKDA